MLSFLYLLIFIKLLVNSSNPNFFIILFHYTTIKHNINNIKFDLENESLENCLIKINS